MRLTRRQAFTVAAIIGLIVAALVYYVLRQQTQVTEAPETQMVTVLVAKQPIGQSDTITMEMLGTTQLDTRAAPAGALTAPGQAVGKIARRDILAEEPLTMSDVTERTAAEGLTFVIPEGMRAVTVALDPISGVGGFVIPHDRVDVLTTFQQGEVAVTKTILQNVEVLAMNEQTTRPAPGGGAQAPAATDQSTGAAPATTEGGAPAQVQVKSATLAVTPDQAQSLLLSAFKGAVHLALRPRNEETVVSLTGQTDWALVGLEPPADKAEAEEEEEEKQQQPPPGWMMYPPAAQAPAAAAPAPRPAPAPAPAPAPTVEVFRGGEREVITLD